jgi:NitT/TauT family transport system substrate-binding protein
MSPRAYALYWPRRTCRLRRKLSVNARQRQLDLMPADNAPLRIMAARHSAFYSPLISTIAGGFLADEGLEATYSVLPPSGGSHGLLQRAEVDVMQSAPGSNWGLIEKGQTGLPLHFALINCRDGFFLAGRKPEPNFQWKSLEGSSLLADHGGQPLLMLRYAVHSQGVDWAKINAIDAGTIAEIDAAFRAGQGEYVHQQGPAPQQLVHEGIGHVVASVGAAMPVVAFSSLMATREFLASDRARAFTRAFRKARAWAQSVPADQIAEKEASFFPQIDRAVLTTTIAAYQRLGCWQGDIHITRDLYEQALEVFLYGGAIKQRHPYDEVVTAPPE